MAGSEAGSPGEWWTTTDVSAYLGVRVATVSTYRKRGQMPAPDQSFGRTHLWRPETIRTWHERRPRPGTGGRPTRAKETAPSTQASAPAESRWHTHGERVIYDSPWVRVGLTDVELPDGQRFEHHTVTLPAAAMTVLLDDARERVLLLWRHRFVSDVWNWELPGGLIDKGEKPEVTAERETIEETGYRPRGLRHVVTFEPMIGTVRSPHHVFVSAGAERVGEATETTESERLQWHELTAVPDLIAEGAILNSGTLIGLLHVLALPTS